jgi:predicted nucleic acid-binding protein
MSKTKKEPKVYTISETIYVSYQVVAMSEEDAQEAYRSLPTNKWDELVAEGASNNYCDDEVVDEEEYNHQTENGEYPISDKAKKHINNNLPEA